MWGRERKKGRLTYWLICILESALWLKLENRLKGSRVDVGDHRLCSSSGERWWRLGPEWNCLDIDKQTYEGKSGGVAKVGYGGEWGREKLRIVSGFLANVKEWMDIPFAEKLHWKTKRLIVVGRQEEENMGTQNVLWKCPGDNLSRDLISEKRSVLKVFTLKLHFNVGHD